VHKHDCVTKISVTSTAARTFGHADCMCMSTYLGAVILCYPVYSLKASLSTSCVQLAHHQHNSKPRVLLAAPLHFH
jgi:hypothetical protein